MKKYKILIEQRDYKEVEIELPFYAYYQGDMEEIFVKITSKEFKQIILHQYGKVEIFKSKTNNSIASIWHENKSDWKQWQEALKNAREIVKSF